MVRLWIKWGLIRSVFREWRGVRVSEDEALRVAAEWRRRRRDAR